MMQDGRLRAYLATQQVWHRWYWYKNALYCTNTEPCFLNLALKRLGEKGAGCNGVVLTLPNSMEGEERIYTYLFIKRLRWGLGFKITLIVE